MTGGADLQHAATGGLSSAPFSLLFSVELPRWTIQTLSCASIETPIVMPSNPSLGNGFGHSGSTSKIGTSTIDCCALAVNCSADKPAPRPMTLAASAPPYMRFRFWMSLIIVASLHL